MPPIDQRMVTVSWSHNIESTLRPVLSLRVTVTAVSGVVAGTVAAIKGSVKRKSRE